jgi:glutathione synthase
MVASKGDPRNDRFFAGELDSPVYGVLVSQKTDFQFDASGQQFQESMTSTKLGSQDVVWLRLPPPADVALFARLTSFAPAPIAIGAHKEAPWSHKKPVIINDPEGIVETGSKAFLHHFPGFTAPVRRMQSADDLREFAALYPIVLKPLQEYGGRGLVKVSNGRAEVDGQEFPLETWLSAADPTAYLGMKFLKNVGQGDKRILVVNGKILGASLRLPAPGEWLCNVARGGTSVVAEVALEEEAMIAAVAPILLKKGIVIFGADTLVDDDGKRVLSELNTNSIGGFPQAEAQTGRPILQQTINGIYDYLEERL